MTACRHTRLPPVRKRRTWSLCSLVAALTADSDPSTATLVAQAMCLLPRLPAAAGGSGALCAALCQQRQGAQRPDRRLAVTVLARDGKKRRKPQSRDGDGSSSSSGSNEVGGGEMVRCRLPLLAAAVPDC